MTWLDNVFEQHRSSNMRVRSLKVRERDLWCVKGAKDGYHMIQSLTAYLFFINCKIILWQKEPKVILSRTVTDQKWNLKSTTPMNCSPFSFQKFSLWSPAHIVLQVSKAFVDSFFFISSYSMYRNVVFVVLLMLARSCFLFHKTILTIHENMAQIHFTETNTQIHSKHANFITKYGSRKRGMGKYGPSKYQSERSDLPQDYLAIWYSSIVVPIYDMRYWPNLFGQDDWILAEFFFFSRFYGLGRSRGP